MKMSRVAKQLKYLPTNQNVPSSSPTRHIPPEKNYFILGALTRPKKNSMTTVGRLSKSQYVRDLSGRLDEFT